MRLTYLIGVALCALVSTTLVASEECFTAFCFGICATANGNTGTCGSAVAGNEASAYDLTIDSCQVDAECVTQVYRVTCSTQWSHPKQKQAVFHAVNEAGTLSFVKTNMLAHRILSMMQNLLVAHQSGCHLCQRANTYMLNLVQPWLFGCTRTDCSLSRLRRLLTVHLE